MTTNVRKPLRLEARLTTWQNPDGTFSEVVRLYGGTRSVAVDLTEVAELVESLQRLSIGQYERCQFLDRLVTE